MNLLGLTVEGTFSHIDPVKGLLHLHFMVVQSIVPPFLQVLWHEMLVAELKGGKE